MRSSFICFLAAFVFSTLSADRALQAQQPFVDPMFGVQITSNLVFGTGAVQYPAPGMKDLTLDLYEPSGAGVPTPRPGLVIIHGGSFTSGTKNSPDVVGVANGYAARGYVVVSINYRLQGDDPPTPGATPLNRAVYAAIQDAATAVGWMRTNAATYRIDPTRIAIGGSSAGSIAALFEGYEELDPIVSVRVILDLWGGLYGMESLIDADDPPVFIVHGTNDTTVPFQLSNDLVARAQAVGLPYEFYPISGAGHGVPLSTVVDGISLLQRSVNFFYIHLDLQHLLLNRVPSRNWRLYE